MMASLPPDLQRFVQEQLSSGSYASEDELLQAALAAFAVRQQKISALREKLRVGIDQLDRGEGIVLEDDEAIDRFIDSLDGGSDH